MKRWLFAILILAAGSVVFCASRAVTAQFRRDSADRHEALRALTALLDQAAADHQQLDERVRGQKRDLQAQRRALAAQPGPAGTIP